MKSAANEHNSNFLVNYPHLGTHLTNCHYPEGEDTNPKSRQPANTWKANVLSPLVVLISFAIRGRAGGVFKTSCLSSSTPHRCMTIRVYDSLYVAYIRCWYASTQLVIYIYILLNNYNLHKRDIKFEICCIINYYKLYIRWIIDSSNIVGSKCHLYVIDPSIAQFPNKVFITIITNLHHQTIRKTIKFKWELKCPPITDPH